MAKQLASLPSAATIERLKQMECFTRNIVGGPGILIRSDYNGMTISRTPQHERKIPQEPRQWGWGIVVAAPEGETEYTDCRYWVKRAHLPNGDRPDRIELQAYPETSGIYEVATVTNLAERGSNSHLLPLGSEVVFWWAYSGYEGEGRGASRRCWISEAAPTVFRVKMTGGSAGSTGTPASFVYSLFHIHDTAMTTAIATGVEVESRLIPVAYTAAPDGSFATAIYDKADEVMKIVAGCIAETVTAAVACEGA